MKKAAQGFLAVGAALVLVTALGAGRSADDPKDGETVAVEKQSLLGDSRT